MPEEVWLEALVNAVIHRAYSNFGDHVRVELFDDRVEVSSPGRFPGITSLSDLMNVPRFSRNPRIARVMTELSYGQEMGEGLRRMVEAMEGAGGQRPLVTQTAGGVNGYFIWSDCRRERVDGPSRRLHGSFFNSFLGSVPPGPAIWFA